MRSSFYISTACYLIKEDKVLLIKFNKKWGQVQESEEGKLEWIDIKELENIKQFDMNTKFTKYVLEEGMFEGKFILDGSAKVLEYKIRRI